MNIDKSDDRNLSIYAFGNTDSDLVLF
ncbi:Protein of unknown function [Anaplasma phagocytophilum]|uniref:Uncharacterized protein n=1 Tax=Anaplasma phagocytophilum TaxID=948 RepID=A0A098EGP5_ANAPH|nr:Protein of unknown function [Anaplasma phagocytophilum]